MTIRAESEQHIEVHKYRGGGFAIAAVAFFALTLQSFLPKYFPQASLMDLPLLVALYFGLARRNPATGLMLGMFIGVLQDAMSGPRIHIGYYGIAKTIVGFFASSIGARLDTEHPLARALIVLGMSYVHQGALVVMSRWLLAQQEDLFSRRVLIASLVNAALSLLLFPLLDRLRKPV
jgi:rod shape-determining protein MreD